MGWHHETSVSPFRLSGQVQAIGPLSGSQHLRGLCAQDAPALGVGTVRTRYSVGLHEPDVGLREQSSLAP